MVVVVAVVGKIVGVFSICHVSCHHSVPLVVLWVQLLENWWACLNHHCPIFLLLVLLLDPWLVHYHDVHCRWKKLWASLLVCFSSHFS